LTWPLPWWLDYLLLAEDWHCPPWELFDRKTPKPFWLECMQHLRHARNVVRQRQERKAEAGKN
jgi:hypothetical protein